jgi:hypothetical protein
VDDSSPRIVESYTDYKHPFDVARTVQALLRTVPEKYLKGLDCVVLTNVGRLSRRERLGKVRSRKRKIDKARVRGFYHHAWQGKSPWIEIRVDKTLGSFTPKGFLWIPLFRKVCLGQVLFHELGHHVHNTIRPEYCEKEDVAEAWGGRFMTNFIAKRYWYAVWPIILFGKIRRRLIPLKG